MNSETDSREILHNDHASKLVEPGEFIMQVQDAERKGKAFIYMKRYQTTEILRS